MRYKNIFAEAGNQKAFRRFHADRAREIFGAANSDVLRTFDPWANSSKRESRVSCGVVMDGEQIKDSVWMEDLEETSSQTIRTPEVTGRMRQLLFGVRLSAATEPMSPAEDLEELARRLDSLRRR